MRRCARCHGQASALVERNGLLECIEQEICDAIKGWELMFEAGIMAMDRRPRRNK